MIVKRRQQPKDKTKRDARVARTSPMKTPASKPAARSTRTSTKARIIAALKQLHPMD